ncbi:MAG: PD-(D/E)XK nuclease-like domain-containing protein [Patescibacteria group bacterium]|nr:PD-(D/E)XK nuclease-like domain-containing protein [Patescibacteria group bacterium]
MFKNCKVIAANYNSQNYHSSNGERGTKDFFVSSSSLRDFAACPSKWIRGWSRPDSASLEYGSLLDTLVLTPDQFESRYAIAPLTYESKGMECPVCKSVTDSKKCAKCKTDRVEVVVKKDFNYQSSFCAEWREKQIAEGKEIASQKDVEDAKAAIKRLYEDDQIRMFLEGCDFQVYVTGEWHDEGTGIIVPVKCLIDLVGKQDGPFSMRIGDLKTTKNASSIAWSKWADFAGYSIQAAWNTDIFSNATGREITDFCFVLSENTPPWETGRRYMTQDVHEPGTDEGSIASGRRQYRKMMSDYCKCVKFGKWPGFDDTDESSASGWTLVVPDPYAEQRRMFAPRFLFGDESEDESETESFQHEMDVTP